MAFLSFVGRLLFASIFVLSAWQEFNEFGDDGGSTAKSRTPKFNLFSKHFTTFTGFQVSVFEIKILVELAIALKAFGSLLFIYGSTIGSTLLILHQMIVAPMLYDFYNYDIENKKFFQLFINFAQSLLLGGLLIFTGMDDTTQTQENIRNAYIEHLKDELLKARLDSEMMFEQINHTQPELSKCYQVIAGLTGELSVPSTRRRTSRGGYSH